MPRIQLQLTTGVFICLLICCRSLMIYCQAVERIECTVVERLTFEVRPFLKWRRICKEELIEKASLVQRYSSHAPLHTSMTGFSVTMWMSIRSNQQRFERRHVEIVVA